MHLMVMIWNTQCAGAYTQLSNLQQRHESQSLSTVNFVPRPTTMLCITTSAFSFDTCAVKAQIAKMPTTAALSCSACAWRIADALWHE